MPALTLPLALTLTLTLTLHPSHPHLQARLAESARRSEAKLRAERSRMAVRYANQGSKPGGASLAAEAGLEGADGGAPASGRSVSGARHGSS